MKDIKNEKSKNKKKSKPKKLNKKGVVVLVLSAALVLSVLFLIGYALYNNYDKVIGEGNLSSEEIELVSFVDAGKGFPVAYTSSDIISAASFHSRIFVISKRLFTCISSTGDVLYSQLFSFSEPEMKVSDNYGLVYDKASTNYFIFNHKGIIYEGSAESTIISAEINNQGDVLISEKSDDSACRVYLVNRKGEVLYIWSCSKEYAVSIDMTDNGEDIIAACIGSLNGEIYTKIYHLNIYSDNVVNEYLLEGSAIIDATLSGKNLIALCSDGIYTAKLRQNSTDINLQIFDMEIKAFDKDSSGNTAVVTNSVGTYGKNKITVYGKNNEITYVGYTDGEILNILCQGKKVYLLTDEGLLKSSSDGTFETVDSSNTDSKDLFVCRGRLFCYTDSKIDLCG